jgi:hypothetical protein
MEDQEALRYPIGRFELSQPPPDPETRRQRIDVLDRTPQVFRGLVARLTDAELETPYRPGGWTIRQVVHHVPDSHMNAYIRMKLAVTEDTPTIKPYDEAKWAVLADGQTAPIGMSLDLLDALHRRWVTFLRATPPADFARTFFHPELGRMSIDAAVAMYAWHSQHHAAHVRNAIARAQPA